MTRVIIYTDGACRGNPGAGGYGAVLVSGENRREISGGFRHTTNNRMEIFAVIAGLRALKRACEVTVVSDSRYVVDAMEKEWAKKWRAKRWMRTPGEPALNADLWALLLEECERHRTRFEWVRGHNGHAENERCDELAVAASHGADLPVDTGYTPR